MRQMNKQKEVVKALIRDARASWESERHGDGQKLSEIEYEARMREFYDFAKEQVLTKWEGVGSREAYFEALQEYAREDWISNGFDSTEFDSKLKQQSKLSRKAAIYGVALGTLSCIGWILLDLLIANLSIFAILPVLLIVWIGWKAGKRLFARQDEDSEIIRLIDKK
jgi:hypothetical protein